MFVDYGRKETPLYTSSKATCWGPIFSPDNSRYISIEKQSMFPFLHKKVLIDKGYQKKLIDVQYGSLTFSPDSKHYAFVALSVYQNSPIIKRSIKHCVVKDGNECAPYDYIAGESQNKLLGEKLILPGSLIFSPCSSHLAYIVMHEGKWFCVIDGNEHERYSAIKNNSFLFSNNGKRHAYSVIENDKVAQVIDGKKHGFYEFITGFEFSEDSKSYCYLAKNADNTSLFYNGKLVSDNEHILSFKMNPVNSGVVYCVKKFDKYFLIHQGDQISNLFNGKGSSVIKKITFSPNGNRLAFVLENDKLHGVVNVFVDGISQAQYDSFYMRNLVFSPDSKHFAYIASRNNKPFVVLDGKELKQYDAILDDPVFNDDGSVIVYPAKSGNSCFLVVNEIERKIYDDIGNRWFIRKDSCSGHTIFESSKVISYLARKEKTYYSVKENV